MSYFTFKDIKYYLPEPVRKMFEAEDGSAKLEEDKEIIEPLIDAEEQRIKSLGFPCIATKNSLFMPVIAAFLTHSLVQQSNQQLQVPYSQIEKSYQDAMTYLTENRESICASGNRKKFSFAKKRRQINGGY